MTKHKKPAKNQKSFDLFDRRDRFRFLRGADFGNPEDYGRKNFAPLKRLIEIIETKTTHDGGTYLTQSELADIWGVSRQTVCAWINTGVAIGVIVTEERKDRGGRRANRTSINWPQVRRAAYGEAANPTDEPEHERHLTALSNHLTALSNDSTAIKEDIRFTDPVEPPPTPPASEQAGSAGAVILDFQSGGGKPPRFARTAFAAVRAELAALGVRNVTRAVDAARRRDMTPADVAAIIGEFRRRAGDFDNPPAALFARLCDLDEFPPPSATARRRRADAAIAAQAIENTRCNRIATERSSQRRRAAADRTAWDELHDDERRRMIEEQKTKFPNAAGRLLAEFARLAYATN